MARIFILPAVLGLLACVAAPVTPKVDEPRLGELDVSSFAGLALTFRDPLTDVVFRVEGPYRVLRSVPDAVELEGFGRDFYETTELLLFMHHDEVWARARVDGREFLARVDGAAVLRE